MVAEVVKPVYDGTTTQHSTMRQFTAIDETYIPYLIELSEKHEASNAVVESLRELRKNKLRSAWDAAWHAFSQRFGWVKIEEGYERKRVAALQPYRDENGNVVGENSKYVYDLEECFTVYSEDVNDVKVRTQSCYITSHIGSDELNYYRTWLDITADIVNGAEWVQAFKEAAVAEFRVYSGGNSEDYATAKANHYQRLKELNMASTLARLFTAEDRGEFDPKQCIKSDWEWFGIHCNRASQGLSKYKQLRKQYTQLFADAAQR